MPQTPTRITMVQAGNNDGPSLIVKATLVAFVFADLATHLARPEPPFVPKRIAELVPEPLRAKHAEAATSGVVLNDQNSSRRA